MKILTRLSGYSNLIRHSSYKFMSLRLRPSDIAQQIIQSDQTISSKLSTTLPSDEVWTDIRKKMINENNIDERLLDSVLFEMMRRTAKTDNSLADISLSYLNFMRNNNNIPINFAIANSLLRTFGKIDDVTKKEYEEAILWMYENIYKKQKILNKDSNSILVRLLSKLNKLDDAEKHLEDAIIPSKLVLINSYFRNKNPEKGWNLLQSLNGTNYKLPNGFLKDFINFYTENFDTKTAQQEVTKFLEFMQNKTLVDILNEETAKELVECLPRINWQSQLIELDHKVNICPNCKKIIQKSKLSSKEHQTLLDFVVNCVLISNDIYKRSSPEEMKNFSSFLQNRIPYDIIIDGLNIYYTTKKGINITMLTEYFKKKNKKVLVLARNHLQKKFLGLSVFENVDLYFFDNETHDDSYLLYAAFKSGPNTKIVTNDMLRSQKWLLQDPNITNLFKKWQSQNHIFCTYNHKTNKNVFRQPLYFLTNIYRDNEGWHIPYSEAYREKNIFQATKSWICIRTC